MLSSITRCHLRFFKKFGCECLSCTTLRFTLTREGEDGALERRLASIAEAFQGGDSG